MSDRSAELREIRRQARDAIKKARSAYADQKKVARAGERNLAGFADQFHLDSLVPGFYTTEGKDNQKIEFKKKLHHNETYRAFRDASDHAADKLEELEGLLDDAKKAYEETRLDFIEHCYKLRGKSIPGMQDERPPEGPAIHSVVDPVVTDAIDDLDWSTLG